MGAFFSSACDDQRSGAKGAAGASSSGASVRASAAAAGDPAPTRSAANDAPAARAPVIPNGKVIVRVTHRSGMPPPPKPGEKPRPFAEPITIIRGDGLAVWSDNPMGGEPYRRGKIERTALASWVERVLRSNTLTDSAMRSYVGPDASSIELDIDLVDQKLKIVSWHEVVDPKKTIATASGLVALDGRDPKAVLAEQPEEYRRFHAGWTSLRAGIDALLPRPGEAVPAGTTLEQILRD